MSQISIHAPVRGATSIDSKITGLKGISIHAPVRGATVIFKVFLYILLFQFTLPCGERLEISISFNKIVIISIHAPVRGATILQYIYCTGHKISIHAPVRGATFKMQVIGLKTCNFNSRSRAGSD